MGHGIVKVGSLFCEWSTVVDAPISLLLDKETAIREFGNDRVEKAEKNGHSYLTSEPDHEYWKFNRAGENEKQFSLEELVSKYT